MIRWMNTGTTYCYDDVYNDVVYAGEFGFDGIELKYNRIKNKDINTIHTLSREHGVKIGAIGALKISADTDTTNDKTDRLKHMLEISSALECGIIVVIPERIQHKESLNDIEEVFIQNLLKYSEISRISGISLAVEITGFADSAINDFYRGYELIHHMNADNVGIVFDFYHFMGMHEDIGKLKSIDKNELFIVHVNDGFIPDQRGSYPDDERVWPGDGEFPISEILDQIKEPGQMIPYSMEVYGKEPWQFSHRKCFEMAKDKWSIINE